MSICLEEWTHAILFTEATTIRRVRVCVCVFVIRCLQKDYYLCCINTHSTVFFESGTLKNTHRQADSERGKRVTSSEPRISVRWQPCADMHTFHHFTHSLDFIADFQFNPSIFRIYSQYYYHASSFAVLHFTICPPISFPSLDASLSISLRILCTCRTLHRQQPDSPTKIRLTAESSDLHGYKRYIYRYLR